MMEYDEETTRINPYLSPMHNNNSSIIFLTDPANELRRFELTLRSMYEDQDGNMHSFGDPLMNDKGIAISLSLLRSVVSQITIMSNITKKQYYQLMLRFSDEVITDLLTNTEEYGLKRENRKAVKAMICNMANICILRAYEEGERRFWRGSTQEITTQVLTPQKSSGIFGKVARGLMGNNQ